jgi:WD40 repeat protein
VCTLDGTLKMWDARSGKCEGEWTGHRGDILDLDLARCGARLFYWLLFISFPFPSSNDFVVTTGGDNTARVFKLHSLS